MDADLKRIAARVTEKAKEICISKSVIFFICNYDIFLDTGFIYLFYNLWVLFLLLLLSPLMVLR